MVTRQPACRGNLGQDLADDATQSVLGQNVVANVVVPHQIPAFLIMPILTAYAMARRRGKAPTRYTGSSNVHQFAASG
ncbi:hypothetical protein VF09_37115 [Nostoc linckia z9]|nr:hypothetical protein VF09_37115 [Nostoc linckia z9]